MAGDLSFITIIPRRLIHFSLTKTQHYGTFKLGPHLQISHSFISIILCHAFLAQTTTLTLFSFSLPINKITRTNPRMKSIFSSDANTRKKTVGYRFHPTDSELVGHFLNRKISGTGTGTDNDMPISEVKICDFEPWDLPDLSQVKSDDRVWYFFSSRDLKYLNSGRSNRTTKRGHWKVTGKHRNVKAFGSKKIIGTKTTLVFYTKKEGYPKGVKTEWIMHEYESIPKGNFVVCKLKTKLKGKMVGKCKPNELASAPVLASESVITANSSCENATTSTLQNEEGFCEMGSYFESQISDKRIDVLISAEGDWSPLSETPLMTDMRPISVATSLEINATESSSLEDPPNFFDDWITDGSIDSEYSHL
ncbi:NAC domain-containing protein 91-like [Mercurialis annua]|uniref:NAC domain-containing protein 91-like n=1 Tax=Mercurialis annua TaxID=3986 RepID=UPI002160E508|nr:NAC domain-containing protein 91-like [Mercurialis annua]